MNRNQLPQRSTSGLPPGGSEYYTHFPPNSSLIVSKTAAKIQAAAWSAIAMKPTTREFSAAIVLLWVLLTGFFWLGYWAGGRERLDRTTANCPENPRTGPATAQPGSESAAEPETLDQTSKRDAPARL